MNQELISIVVPVYKVEKCLTTCVESIVNQTYKKLEIILIDDGSPDSCPEMCDEWAKKDSRIIVIHQQNGGISAARNSGLEVVHGIYTSIIDSDDSLDHRYIEELYLAIKKGDFDIAISDYQRVNENFEPIEEKDKTELITCETTGKALLSNLTMATSGVWGKLYKTEIIKNFRFPVGKLSEDNIFCHRVFSKTDRIVCVGKRLYNYMLRSTSLTQLNDNYLYKTKIYEFEALDDRIQCYKEKGWYNLIEQVEMDLVKLGMARLKIIYRIDFDSKEREKLAQDIMNYIKKYGKDVIESEFLSLKAKSKLVSYLCFPKIILLLIRIDAYRHNLRYKMFPKNTSNTI